MFHVHFLNRSRFDFSKCFKKGFSPWNVIFTKFLVEDLTFKRYTKKYALLYTCHMHIIHCEQHVKCTCKLVRNDDYLFKYRSKFQRYNRFLEDGTVKVATKGNN